MSAQSTNVETLRALDQLRLRLQTLSTTLSKLVHDLSTTDPLPPWQSIQNSLSLAQHSFSSLQTILASEKYQSLLKAAHVRPNASFPGRTQEGLLEMLLRKRMQPGVEDWIAKGKAYAPEVQEAGALSLRELEELWEWAGPEANRIARDDIGEGWDDVFTLAESEAGIENVVTGLTRKLWESEGEESDDDVQDGEPGKGKKGVEEYGDAMDVDVKDREENRNVSVLQKLDSATRIMMQRKFEDSRPSLPLEVVLRFQLTGQLPQPGGGGGGAQIRR